MAKYKVYLTEHEAKMLRAMYEDTIITSMLKPKVLKVLAKIGLQLERQAEWNTW